QKKRGEIWQHYATELAGWAHDSGVTLPHVPAHCEQPYHMFYMLMKDGAQRERFLSHLEKQGILAVFHYLPLHVSAMGRKFGGKDGDCPVAESISGRLVRLPFYNRLTDAEQGDVIAAAKSFRDR